MRRKVLIGLVGLLIVTGAAQAQSIRGQIFVPNPGHNERIEVRLEKDGGQLLATTYSDATGIFLFYNTPTMVDGLNVVIKLDGYEPVNERVTFGTTGSTNLKITLVEKGASIRASTASTTDDAVVDVKRLSESYPKKLLDEYEKAQDDSRKGNPAKAAERLESILQQLPHFYQARNALGSVYQKMERFEDAEREYNRAYEQNPEFALPLVNLGGLYIHLADAQARENPNAAGQLLKIAAGHLQKAVTIAPRYSMGHFLLGTVYYRVGAYADAEENLKRAVELEDATPQARVMLINLYTRQQKWQSALEQIDVYLAENPKSADRAQIQAIRSRVVQNLQAQPK